MRARLPEFQKVPTRPGNIVAPIAEIILAPDQRPHAFGDDLGCHRNGETHMAAEIAEQALVFQIHEGVEKPRLVFGPIVGICHILEIGHRKQNFKQ